VPSDIADYGRVTPNLIELPGWSENLSSIRRLADLPANARDYIRYVEEQTNTPVGMIGVGPDRDQTIFSRRELLWANPT